MRSAARLYRAQVAMIAAGLLVLLAAAGAVFASTTLHPGSLGAIAAACGRALPSLDAAGAIQLFLGVLAASALVLAMRSAARQLQATRGHLGDLEICNDIEIAGTPCVIVADRRPLAFCAGFLRPRVYLSTGALAGAPEEELRAVVAHEHHHVIRRDPLRLLVLRILADALFFLPALRGMSARYASLIELAADEAALQVVGRRQPIAAALLRFSRAQPEAAAVAAIAPERVDHLDGDPDATLWRLPRSALLASAAAAGVFALALGLLAHLGLSSLNLPMLFAQSCMAIMAVGGLALVATGTTLWSRPSEPRPG